MKKITYKSILSALTNKQLKNILGGSGGCGAAAWTGDNFAYICNVSKDEAMDFFNHWNTSQKWWCCDSCHSTWYCGNG